MFKKYATLCAAMALALNASAAMAEGAPQWQFGFDGWPYRQQPPCATKAPVETTKAPDAGVEWPSVSTPTAVPTTNVTVAPTTAPQPATQAPQATPRPTATKAPTTGGDYTTQSATAQEQKMLNLLNADRAANGLAPLTMDAELCRLARLKSADMRDNNYFAHESPTYGRVKDMLTSFGYAFKGAGENIAHHATVEKAEAAFMSSDGHRHNILSSAWQKVGIGIVQDANGYVYVTQIFVR